MKDKEKRSKIIATGIGFVFALIFVFVGCYVIWNVMDYELKNHEEKIWVPKNHEVYLQNYSLLQLKNTAFLVEREAFQSEAAKSEKPIVLIFSQETPEKMTGKQHLPVEYLLQRKSGIWVMTLGKNIPEDSVLNSETVIWTARFDEQWDTMVFTPTRSSSTLLAGIVITLLGAIPASILWRLMMNKLIKKDPDKSPHQTGKVEIM